MAENEEVVFTTSTGPVRVITAASLFDGHDAAINVMRRLIQSSGAEVIHLGHDQSAKAVVDCAIQEDAHAVALTSYQGGHVEYFTYIRQLLDEAGCEHVRIFGGGGGTITPPEIRTLHQSGISKIYSPDDGRTMGLMGMIHHLMGLASEVDLDGKDRMKSLDGPISPDDMAKVGLLLTLSESADEKAFKSAVEACRSSDKDVPVIGFTGTGGAGKSSLLDELMLRIQRDNPGKKVCLLCVDPTRKRTGGALLGDRIRMNALSGPLHGRANQACLEFVQRIGTSDPDEIEAFVRSELAARRPIYGFGHGVLRAEDPRARLLIELGEEICPDDENFRTVTALREVVPPILKEIPKISNPYPNVDLASGSLLHSVGFRKPDYYTTFFGWARVAGICAQILDERSAREGRGTPIYRPKYIPREQPHQRLE